MNLAYEPYQPRMFPLFIYYIFLLVFCIFVTIKVFSKWRKRKEAAALHLTYVFTSFVLALIMLIMGMAEIIITGYKMEIYRITFPLAYCMVVVADIFLYRFAIKITNKGQKALIPIIVFGLILILILLLPWNWWGHPAENYKGQLNIRLYSSLLFVSYSILIYLMIAIICQRTKKMTTGRVTHAGLSFLLYSVICMICFFIFIMLDNVLIVLYDHPGYSEFLYVAWSFTLLFAIFIYMSLVMPKWLVKRIESKDQKE